MLKCVVVPVSCSASAVSCHVGLGCCLVLAAMGCSDSSIERPPFLDDQDCEGSLCGPVVIGPNPPTGAAPPPGGGNGGVDGLDGGLAESLEAEISLASSPDLMTTQRLDGVPLSVRLARDPALELARVNGSDPFTLPGDRLPAWLTIRPLQASADIFPTTQWADLGSSPQQLLVMDRVTLADVGESLVLSPQAPNPALGHALVTFVDAQGAPLPGVSVEAPSGVVAYDLGATFTDATLQTDQRGSVAWMNVTSSGPELPLNLQILYQEGIRTVGLPIAADTVTIARIALQ